MDSRFVFASLPTTEPCLVMKLFHSIKPPFITHNSGSGHPTGPRLGRRFINGHLARPGMGEPRGIRPAEPSHRPTGELPGAVSLRGECGRLEVLQQSEHRPQLDDCRGESEPIHQVQGNYCSKRKLRAKLLLENPLKTLFLSRSFAWQCSCLGSKKST